MRNTKKKGKFRMVALPSSDSKFKYAVACIDFAIVREGNDVMKLVNEVRNASINYLENVCKNDLSDKLLNQTLPKKYINAYEKAEVAKKPIVIKKKTSKAIKSPIGIADLRSWGRSRVSV